MSKNINSNLPEESIEITDLKKGNISLNEVQQYFVDAIVEGLRPQMNKSYNLGIDHAIEVINNYYLDNPNTWQFGHFDIIIKKLEKLKSK